MLQFRLFVLLGWFLFPGILKAQDPNTHFLFVYAQKKNGFCGDKVLVKNSELVLEPKAGAAYQKTVTRAFDQEYNTKNGYNYCKVNLVAPGNVIICYQGTKPYTSFNCTSTFYGCIIAKDFPTAVKNYELYKARNKDISYSELQRWPNSEGR